MRTINDAINVSITKSPKNVSQAESIDVGSEAMGSENMELAVIMGVLLIGIPVLLMSVCFFGYIATKCVREEGNQQPANL